MFQLNAVAIAPGINLRRAPAPFEPVAFDQRELLKRVTNRRAQRQSLFPLWFSVGRLGLAMKIGRVENQILVNFEYPTKAPTSIHRALEVTANSHGALNYKIDLLAERDSQTGVVPELSVTLRNGRLGLSAGTDDQAHEHRRRGDN